MSSKTRILAFAVAFAMIAGFGFAAQADVTGSFKTSIEVFPGTPTQTPTSEIQFLTFDIQNELNLNVVISGLTTSLHSHFGLAGVEDVTLGYAATLGALDINGKFVFGRFAGVCEFQFGNACVNFSPDSGALANNPVPLTQNMLFIKKRVKTSISLGGVSFENLALIEDVNYPETLAKVTHSESNQVFGFGDVLTLSGQTPSGVSIEASTGICASRTPNTIKKHWFPYEVNPHCAGVGFFVQVENWFFEDEHVVRTTDRSSLIDVTESFTQVSGDNDDLIEDNENWEKTYTYDVKRGTEVSGATVTLDTSDLQNRNASVVSNTCDTVDDNGIQDGESCSVEINFGEDWGEPFNTGTDNKEGPGQAHIRMIVEHDDEVVKPNLAFDFETLNISGVPVASGITASAEVVCDTTFACSFTNTFDFSGKGPIPFSVTFQFADLFTFDFDGAELTFSTGAGTLTVEVLEDGTIGTTTVDLSTTLNPDTNPATFNVNATMVPGVGLTDANLSLAIERSNVTFDVAADFGTRLSEFFGGGPLKFDEDELGFNSVTFGVSTTLGAVDVSTDATFGRFGFRRSETSFTINF